MRAIARCSVRSLCEDFVPLNCSSAIVVNGGCCLRYLLSFGGSECTIHTLAATMSGPGAPEQVALDLSD